MKKLRNHLSECEDTITPIGVRSGIWLVWLLLAAGLLTTTLAVRHTKAAVDLAAEKEFESVCNEIRGKVMDRLSAHEQLLRSGSAFIESTPSVSRQEWKTFTERQKVEQQLPGIQGIGFALQIPRQKLEQHIQEIRAEGFPAYQVRPEGERELYTSIIFLEPFINRNLRAFGYDMLSEPVRRAAMEWARDQDVAWEGVGMRQGRHLGHVPACNRGGCRQGERRRRARGHEARFGPGGFGDAGARGILKLADIDRGT